MIINNPRQFGPYKISSMLIIQATNYYNDLRHYEDDYVYKVRMNRHKFALRLLKSKYLLQQLENITDTQRRRSGIIEYIQAGLEDCNLKKIFGKC